MGRIAGDDDGRGMAGRLEQSLGEGEGKVHAAMAFRVTGEPAGMQRDTVPGQALLERHRRVVVLAGTVFCILLQDGEYAGRRLVPGFAGGDGAHADPHAVAVDGGELFRQVDEDQQRALR